MFERLLLRASDAVGPDPTGPPTVNPELIVGPMVRPPCLVNLEAVDRRYCYTKAYWHSSERLAIRDAIDAGQHVLPVLHAVISRIPLVSCLCVLKIPYACRDSKWIKGLVIFLVLADTVNSVFDIYFTYDYNVVCLSV